MHHDIDRILIDRNAIQHRVAQIAQEIAIDLDPNVETGNIPIQPRTLSPTPTSLTLVPILTGSIIFVSDLIRRLPLQMQIHMVSVSSYPGTSTTSRGAQIRQDLTSLPGSLCGCHVLVVDDILDSGKTLRLVTKLVSQRNPASVRTCVLLRKQRPDVTPQSVNYVCFEIDDEFVVGYGLDFNDHYRNLPDIVTLKPEVFERPSDQR